MRHRKGTWWLIALLVASCGGASKWDLACGCASNSSGAGQELGISTYQKDGSIDPVILVRSLDERLMRRGAAVELIVAVREFGPFHDHACYAPSLDSARCYYWLWTSGNQRRGIQVDINGGCVGVEPRSCAVTYKYVEEPS
jgi:hypothetical protein